MAKPVQNEFHLVSLAQPENRIPRNGDDKVTSKRTVNPVTRVIACYQKGDQTRCVDAIRPSSLKHAKEDRVLGCSILGRRLPKEQELKCSDKRKLDLDRHPDVVKGGLLSISECDILGRESRPEQCVKSDWDVASMVLYEGVKLANKEVQKFIDGKTALGGEVDDAWCVGSAGCYVVNKGTIFHTYLKSHVRSLFSREDVARDRGQVFIFHF
jgi:hypothetical protein